MSAVGRGSARALAGAERGAVDLHDSLRSIWSRSPQICGPRVSFGVGRGLGSAVGASPATGAGLCPLCWGLDRVQRPAWLRRRFWDAPWRPRSAQAGLGEVKRPLDAGSPSPADVSRLRDVCIAFVPTDPWDTSLPPGPATRRGGDPRLAGFQARRAPWGCTSPPSPRVRLSLLQAGRDGS